ncbi:unnamed protein product [Prorocentrum cordatum]|uniref:Uncharacterized protein n=1 Tax=Prorocentrum cordatum TaxID=2364126 RepID=A0ABN9S5F2_9DINO|nr:unnamed protein product [Polarella glacialis]
MALEPVTAGGGPDLVELQLRRLAHLESLCANRTAGEARAAALVAQLEAKIRQFEQQTAANMGQAEQELARLSGELQLSLQRRRLRGDGEEFAATDLADEQRDRADLSLDGGDRRAKGVRADGYRQKGQKFAANGGSGDPQQATTTAAKPTSQEMLESESIDEPEREDSGSVDKGDSGSEGATRLHPIDEEHQRSRSLRGRHQDTGTVQLKLAPHLEDTGPLGTPLDAAEEAEKGARRFWADMSNEVLFRLRHQRPDFPGDLSDPPQFLLSDRKQGVEGNSRVGNADLQTLAEGFSIAAFGPGPEGSPVSTAHGAPAARRGQIPALAQRMQAISHKTDDPPMNADVPASRGTGTQAPNLDYKISVSSLAGAVRFRENVSRRASEWIDPRTAGSRRLRVRHGIAIDARDRQRQICRVHRPIFDALKARFERGQERSSQLTVASEAVWLRI